MSVSASYLAQSEPEKPISEQKRNGRVRRRRFVPRAALKPGTWLDAYRIDRLVGHGGFSLVYSGEDCRTGKRVIIKEYYPKKYVRRQKNRRLVPYGGKRLLGFTEGFRQFLNEALALEKVSHPNVLDAFDFLHSNNTAYLVSPDTGGRSLKWFVENMKEPLDQPLLYQIFMPIMSALNFMHEAHLLHLDIKPNNILLQPNSQPLLLDFGAARIMNAATWENRKQTLTPGFAPPEQRDRNRDPGYWSDIYSLAATMYYCIAGKVPAEAQGKDSSPSLDIKYFGTQYDLPLLESINRALAYDPADRYHSVDDFGFGMLMKSGWSRLQDYELQVMRYDRTVQSTRKSQDEILRLIA